jgi:thiamine kinase-like enzyme
MNRLGRWLKHACDTPLKLVPTHGDFSLVNALATDDGLRFIDWEGIAPGGLYSDLFNFAFVERYYERVRSGFADLLDDMFARYREACRDALPGFRRAAETGFDFARRQYYLERLRVLVDRQPSAHLAGVIQKSISMFDAFDRERGMILE